MAVGREVVMDHEGGGLPCQGQTARAPTCQPFQGFRFATDRFAP
jgi:hypothetical protein